MKKLQSYKGDVTIPVYGTIADAQIYLKSDADKFIADLEESHKKEVAQLLIINRDQANAASRLRDSMEQAIRQLERALWIAREWRAWCEGQFWFVLESAKPRDIFHLSCTNRIHRTPNEWITYWQKVEQLCEKKAEEYK